MLNSVLRTELRIRLSSVLQRVLKWSFYRSKTCFKNSSVLQGLTPSSARQNLSKWLAPLRPPKDRPATRSRRVKKCAGAERAPTLLPAPPLQLLHSPGPDRLPAPGAPPKVPDCPDFWLLESRQQVSLPPATELRGRDAWAPYIVILLDNSNQPWRSYFW